MTQQSGQQQSNLTSPVPSSGAKTALNAQHTPGREREQYRSSLQRKGAVDLSGSGSLSLAEVQRLAGLGCSPLLGMFERPKGRRALGCDRPLMRRFIRGSNVIQREYGAAISEATGSAA